jgi:predicted nucleic acid-binding protein
VTVVARRATTVLLDTSPFISFAEAGALIPLAQYLADRAAILLDVANELRRNAAGRFPQLKTLDMLRWPPGEPLSLPPELLADAEALRRLHSPAGAHEAANRGEIATVLLAARVQDALVVMDDELGTKLCRMRGVDRLSTAQLAAEMVVAGGFDEDTGFGVFDAATPARVGRPEFSEAVARAKAAPG